MKALTLILCSDKTQIKRDNSNSREAFSFNCAHVQVNATGLRGEKLSNGFIARRFAAMRHLTVSMNCFLLENRGLLLQGALCDPERWILR